MKRRIKYGLAGLALGLSCLFGAPAFANDYTGDCASYPGSFDGTGDVDITDSSCSIGDITAAGHISITATGTVTTGNLSTSYGQITVASSGGAVSTGTITPGWYATITADGTITPGDIYAGGGEVNLVSANGAVTAQAITGYYHVVVTAKNDINTGIITSTNNEITITSSDGKATTEDLTGYYHVYVTAKNDVTLGEVRSTNNEVHLKSETGDIVTEDPINAYFEVKIEAPEGKVTVDKVESTYYDVQIKAGDEIITDSLTGGQYGNLVVTNTSGDITTKEVETGSSIKVKAEDGAIDLDTVTSNTGDLGGNILIVGSENVKTKAISTVGTTSYGAVEIRANTGGGSSVFTIGDTNAANGVNGSINTSNTTGGGTEVNFIHGGLFVINGTTGAGGITVKKMTDINVNASSSRSGLILMDARDSNITFLSSATNVLQSDGAAGYGAGEIVLRAKEIRLPDDSVISASQTMAATGTGHGVILSAESVKFGGTSGLQIHADGKGSDQYTLAFAEILPQDAVSITSNSADSDTTYQYLYFSVSLPNGFSTDKTLNLTGTGSAPLTVTADGDNALVAITGHPMNFTGGDVTIHSRGDINHQVQLVYYGTLTAVDGLSFASTTGNVNIDANGKDGDGGSVRFTVDHATVSSPIFNVSANGPLTGDGAGGDVYIYSTNLTISSTTKAAIKAEGALAGTGDAQYGDPNTNDRVAIRFYPNSDISLGTSDGQYSFSANGGSTGGNGGTIYIVPNGNVTTITDQQVVTASGLADDSNGGWIIIAAYIQSATINNITTPWAIDVHGHGTGLGGKFLAYHNMANLNVNALIRVDGGDGLDDGDSDGEINLNNVSCRQWLTGSGGDFAKTYWNCHDTTRSFGLNMASEAAAIPSGLQTLLSTTLTDSNKVVQIYLMSIISDYGSYFGTPTFERGVYGATRVENRASAAFRNVYRPSDGTVILAATLSNSSTILRASIVHELGHQLEWMWGATGHRLSEQVGFYGLRAADFVNMDAQTCTDVLDNSICTDYLTVPSNSGKFLEENPKDKNTGAAHDGDSELFAQMFEHLISNKADPFLEQPLGFLPGTTNFILPGTAAYLQGLIAAPPSANN